MGITYNAGTNTITVTGTYTGNLLASILAADVAGGWGVFTVDASGVQYNSTALINIGDGSTATVVSDTAKNLSWSGSITGGSNILYGNKATITFGNLISATDKSTSLGVNFVSNLNVSNVQFYFTSDCTVYFYSCTIKSTYVRTVYFRNYATRVWNCIFDRTVVRAMNGCDFFNFTAGTTYNDGLFNTPSSNTYDTLNLYGHTSVFVAAGSAAIPLIVVNNAFGRGNQYVLSLSNVLTNGIAFVNCDFDSWAFNFLYSGTAYKQYTFDVETDVSATVTLKNGAGANVFSVTADGTTGKIATQTVSRGYYDQANGNTLQDYGPFTLTISKAGYITYTHTGIVLDEPIDWRISLKKLSYIGNGTIKFRDV